MTHTTLPRHARTGMLAVGWRKARTGENPGELYPIWPILGGAPDDEDQDEDDTGSDGGDDEEQDDASTGGQANDSADQDSDEDEDAGDGTTADEGTGDLGDKGKQALDRMKARLKAERQRRRDVEAERDQLKAAKDGDEQDPERIRAEAEQAATAKANARIVRSEVRAAAAGKLANPRDALAFIDLSQFEVDEDGKVDEDDVADAIDNLLTERPYLAAVVKQPRFQGTGDGGARKNTGGPKQLNEHDVKKMTPEQIDEAHRKGQLRDYLGG